MNTYYCICDRFDKINLHIIDMFLEYNKYIENPKKYSRTISNRIKSDKMNNKIDVARKILVIEYFTNNIFDIKKLSKIMYDWKYPYNKYDICDFCELDYVMYKDFRYSKWCSSQCAKKDFRRISEESKNIGIYKRNIKMQELFNDPKRNAEYRNKISESSKKRMNTPEEKLRHSTIMKEKIRKGEFTPCVTNSWTRWKVNINNKKFRSSFEGLFYLYHNIFRNDNILYEKLRIPYIDEYDKQRIYIVDFIDDKNKNVYEIKPYSQIDNENNKLKLAALKEWSKNNNFNLHIITENELSKLYHEMISDREFNHSFLVEIKGLYKWMK